jgi:hypothetical protein
MANKVSHLVASLLFAGACHHADSATTAKTTPLANQAPPTAAHRPIGDLAMLPVDSDAVIGVNFSQLQQSPLWKQYMTPIIAGVPGVKTFQSVCGFDPLASLQTITVGIKEVGDGAAKPTGTIVLHGYDRGKAMACLDAKGIKQAEQLGTRVIVDDGVVMVAERDGVQVGFVFVDETTLIAVIGPNAGRKESILRIAAGTGDGLEGSQAFKEMYGKINTHDSVWVLVNGNAPGIQKLVGMGMHMRALFGSLNVTDGLSADVRLRVASPDEAASLTQLAQGQLPQAKQFFDKLDIVNEAEDIKISAAMSSQKLQQLVTMVGGFRGGGFP